MSLFIHLLERDSTSIGLYLSPPRRAYIHTSKQTATPPLLFSNANYVYVVRNITENFKLEKGTRQGDGLAPLLFNIALRIAIIKSEVQINGTIFNKTQHILGYANDVVITGRRIQDVEEALIALDKETQKLGFKINTKKSKFTSITIRQNDRVKEVKMRTYKFEKVEKFKYLGATVTNRNDTREEIKHRINMGNACYYSVEKILSSSLLSKNLKVRIYKTVILPVVLYGCEAWTLTLREEHRLRVFENKVLRKIFGAKRDEVTGEWRKLHNTELHALYSSPDIIRNIKSIRLRWAGHVARMGESKNAYRVLVGRPEGKRPLGRPRRIWEDNIKMDLREVGYVRTQHSCPRRDSNPQPFGPSDRDMPYPYRLRHPGRLDRDRWRAYVRATMNLRVP
ncbi:hypothetical protein ANN_13457 [Periplaneta americana]|uniref:Reverse transcriptase domain-containing protein n=1 Tax=Periplaneta americana TaxID=6978 RepID=A0ABQ8TMZ2_PERAM|nr:hypothetical protein ANN_13457 [Periplaneta americana]